MTNEKLPKIHLETFVIIPFQISTKENSPPAQEKLHAELEKKYWEKLSEHKPDRITLESMRSQSSADSQKTNIGLDDLIQYQAYNYFHPFVRKFWYDKKIVTRFRHKEAHEVEIEYKEANKIKFDLVCDLLHFSSDIGVLCLHIKSKEPINFKEGQDVLDRFRRTHPPYICIDPQQNLFGGHYPHSITIFDKNNNIIAESDKDISSFIHKVRNLESETDPIKKHLHVWSSHFEYILKPLCTNWGEQSEFFVTPLGDDRATLVNLVSVDCSSDQTKYSNEDNNKRIPWHQKINRGNYIRLCFADASGSDVLPYSSKYLDNFEDRFCYDRFWYQNKESKDAPSRVMVCSYAFTWIGDKNDKYYFNDQTSGAPATLRHIYAPMVIIAQFQKAKILATSRKLADMTQYKEGLPKFEKEKHKEFLDLKKDFIAFTQTYWFDEITPQEQGIELYNKLRTELALREIYDEARQEIHDIVDFIQTEQNQEISENSERITKIGVPIALFGLFISIISTLFGFFGANFIDFDGKYSLNTENILNTFSTASINTSFSIQNFIIIFTISIAAIIATWHYFLLKKQKQK